MKTPQELLKEFAELKVKEKQLKAQIEFLKPEVTKIAVEKLADLDEKAVIGIEELGTLCLVRRKTWMYSDFVAKSEEALKSRKLEEEQTGEATYTEKIGVMFNTIKN